MEVGGRPDGQFPPIHPGIVPGPAFASETNQRNGIERFAANAARGARGGCRSVVGPDGGDQRRLPARLSPPSFAAKSMTLLRIPDDRTDIAPCATTQRSSWHRLYYRGGNWSRRDGGGLP